MARRRRARSDLISRPVGRDTSDYRYAEHAPSDLLLIDDRRRFYPAPFPTSWPPARSYWGGPSRLALSEADLGGRRPPGWRAVVRSRVYPRKPHQAIQKGPGSIFGFAGQTHRLWTDPPSRVVFDRPLPTICDRRRIRREVMHAFGHTGRGRPKQRPPRRNEFSSVGC